MAGVSAGDDGTEDDGDSGRGWRVQPVPSFFCCKIRRGSVWYGSGEFYERRGAEMTRYRLNNIKLPLEAGDRKSVV